MKEVMSGQSHFISNITFSFIVDQIRRSNQSPNAFICSSNAYFLDFCRRWSLRLTDFYDFVSEYCSAWLPECHLRSLLKSVDNLPIWHEGSQAGETLGDHDVKRISMEASPLPTDQNL